MGKRCQCASREPMQYLQQRKITECPTKQRRSIVLLRGETEVHSTSIGHFVFLLIRTWAVRFHQCSAGCFL